MYWVGILIMNTNEIWKDIPNYEGLYQVSNLGNIRNKKRLILKPHKHNYLMIKLWKNNKGKNYNIHSLVAICFLNHIPNKFTNVIDHIDSNKFNNKLENLRIITMRENISKDKKNKTSKFTGVRFKSKKYEAQITINNKQHYLGRFNCEFKAHLCYINKLKSINQ